MLILSSLACLAMRKSSRKLNLERAKSRSAFFSVFCFLAIQKFLTWFKILWQILCLRKIVVFLGNENWSVWHGSWKLPSLKVTRGRAMFGICVYVCLGERCCLMVTWQMVASNNPSSVCVRQSVWVAVFCLFVCLFIGLVILVCLVCLKMKSYANYCSMENLPVENVCWHRETRDFWGIVNGKDDTSSFVCFSCLFWKIDLVIDWM